MKIIYEAARIENALTALNQLQVVGVRNAELVTFIVQELKNHDGIENNEVADEKAE